MKEKKIDRLLATLLLFYLAVASAYGDGGLPLIKNWDNDNGKPQVEDSRDNIFCEKVPNKEILKATPANCLAREIADIEYKTIWRPKWHYTGAGVVRIPGAALSPDKSVLAIIENSGRPGGLSGSRVILLNTYNYKLLLIIELREQLLTKICFIADTAKLAGAVAPQKALKQSPGLAIIDLKALTPPKKIKTSQKISAIACSEQKIFTLFADGTLKYFNINNPTVPSGTIKLFNPITALAFHQPTNRLLATERGKLNYLKLSTMATDIYAETSLPENFKADKIILTDNVGNCVLLKSNERLIISRNRKSLSVNITPGAAADMDMSKMLLATVIRRRQQIQLLNLSSMDRMKLCDPHKLKPKTTGDITTLVFLPAAASTKPENVVKRKKRRVKSTKQNALAIRLLIIDSQGNIYRIELIKKRWRKMLILSPQK